MRWLTVFFGCAVFGCLSALLPGSAPAQFEEMVRHVPETANAMVLVNVKKLLGSPMAQEGNWRGDAVKRFAGGLTSIPPDANQLVVAAELDLKSMRPVWEMALVHLDSAPSLSTLARQYGGTTDTVAGAAGLRLPDDTYLVRFSERLLGGIAPGNRQAVSRWIRGSGRSLSPHLQEAVGYATGGTELIMALDMTDVAAIEDVRQGIAEFDSPVLKVANIDVTELAQLLASVRSLMLGVKFDKRAFGKIKLDFGRDASMLSGIAKPLVLAILAHRGLMIDEFENWKAEVEGNRILFGGYLTNSGLTRLSSLVELPTPALYGLAPAQVMGKPSRSERGQAKKPTQSEGVRKAKPKPSEDEQPKETSPRETPRTGATSPGEVPQIDEDSQSYLQATVQATRQYFRSTQHLLGDLRGRKREAKTVPQIGQWYENYARKIDRLPLLQVDDQMLGYGGYTANQLRNASLAIKASAIRSRVGQATAVNQGVSGRVLGTTVTRGMTLREQAAVRTQVRTQERATAAASFQQIEMEIDATTTEIRGVMTKKYQVEF